MLRTARAACLAGALMGAPPIAGAAAIETIEFEGYVSDAFRVGAALPAEWQFLVVGETRFAGAFGLDPGAADTDAAADTGRYAMDGLPFWVEIGPLRFAADSSLVMVYDDVLVFGAGYDSQIAFLPGVWGQGPLAPFGHLRISFGSGLKTAIASDALLAGAALVDTFPQRTLFLQTCGSPESGQCTLITANVFGVIDEVRDVPELSAAASGLAAAAGLAIVSARRRRFVAGALAAPSLAA